METRYRLFIDDIRDPVAPDWVIARTSFDATSILEARGCRFELSFDHDLSGEDTAMVVVRKLVTMDLDAGGGFIPADFVYSVHSANPVGKANVEGLLGAYLRQREISVDRPAAY
jgi:hypothetical protein